MKNIPLTAAVFGAIGVCLGAFGAHALEARLEATSMTSAWNTAVLYHLLHAAMAWVASRDASRENNPTLRRAAIAWIFGILFFSGSLYTIALGGPRWMGPITPIGGLCFIVGWIMAAMAARKST